ncbi:unnamed protein product [Rhizopus stolonifer]
MVPKITRPKNEEAVSHIQVKNGFKSYAYNLYNILQNEKIGNTLPEEGKTKLNAVVNEFTKWLYEFQETLKNSLGSCVCSLRNTLQDERIGDILPKEDKNKLSATVGEYQMAR